jgi:hypothetical protein
MQRVPDTVLNALPVSTGVQPGGTDGGVGKDGRQVHLKPDMKPGCRGQRPVLTATVFLPLLWEGAWLPLGRGGDQAGESHGVTCHNELPTRASCWGRSSLLPHPAPCGVCGSSAIFPLL